MVHRQSLVASRRERLGRTECAMSFATSNVVCFCSAVFIVCQCSVQYQDWAEFVSMLVFEVAFSNGDEERRRGFQSARVERGGCLSTSWIAWVRCVSFELGKRASRPAQDSPWRPPLQPNQHAAPKRPWSPPTRCISGSVGCQGLARSG